MKKRLTYCLVVCASAWLIACGDSDSPENDTQGPTDTTAPADVPSPTDSAEPACDVEPTITSIATNYFERSCNFSSCHDGSTKAGGLDLTPGAAYDSLVNVNAVHPGASGKVLVMPGDPDTSFIVQKVEGPGAGEGGIMPLNAAEPVDPDCSIKRLREWIADGAKP